MSPEANGMLRMMVAYTDESNELVPCYDRYVGHSPDSRDLLLPLPSATAGSLTVFSLAEFGPFE
ncbi:MAG: hypothetical protein V4819_01935 [Verrucomicrobiota bacterium]